ncbi:MAG: FecR domain-containing protein, partial [Tannerella sp.]|nr:FecR domain-containing protein [Tannerella sp.]
MIKKDINDFLKDPDFISWQLTGEEELGTYWKDYIDRHPGQKEDFDAAIHTFSRVKLEQEKLTENEYLHLKERIRHSISQGKRKKRNALFIRYAAAACIALAAIFSVFQFTGNREDKKMPVNNQLIVGENLEEKDIYLITDSETASFSQDVVVKVDETGSTTVQEVKGEKTIRMDAGKTEMNKLIVPYGKRSRLEFPDGTKAWLNSGSVLEFPSSFKGKTREVSLKGEMYVEVAKDHDRSFYVNTPDFQVRVYGTKFNISSYENTDVQSVVLVEGSVSVKAAFREELFIEPDEMLVRQNNTMEKSRVDVTRYISWKDGYLQLDKTPVAEVLKQVERYYNLSFDMQEN